MKIELIKDIERDIWNWQESVAVKSYGVIWKKFLPADISAERVRDKKYLRNYLDKKFYRSGKVSEFKNWVECNLNTPQIKEDLERLMGKKFPFRMVKIFITTFHRAPYNVKQKFFYLIWRDFDRKKSVTTNIYHELMHFLFHLYYWNKCRKAGLSDAKIHILKESLTVLLNPILEKRKLPLDTGYIPHQEIRTKLRELWQKENNFDLFLDKAVKLRILTK